MSVKLFSRLFIGVAVLGASSLVTSAGGAKAAVVCTFPNSTPSDCGSASVTINGGTITPTPSLNPNPTVGSGDVEVLFQNPGLIGKPTYHVDVDFTPDILGAAGGTTGAFDYNIKTLVPILYSSLGWNGAQNGSGQGPSVTKQIYSKAGYNVADLVTSLTVNGSVYAFQNPYTELWIRDIYSVPENALLDNFINNFAVPGPLPLLGAGTAFGFSRRLRRRSKARLSLG